MRFCLKLDEMHHVSEEEFKSIRWLPTSKRVDQCINAITYNFINKTSPYYLNESFEFSLHCSIGRSNKVSKFKNPFRKTSMGKKLFLILVTLFGTVCLTHLKERIV